MSNISTYRIQLDIKKITSQSCISIPKGNTGRRLFVQLVDEGKPVKIARGSYATFVASKPDDTTVWNDTTIQNDIIIYDFTEQTISSVGNVECEIDLYDSTGYLITSPRFSLIVYDSIRNRVDLPSESEMDVLSAIGVAEAGRREAEFKRQDEELTRIFNEELRGINEAYRVASENTLRAYIGNYQLDSIDKPEDILGIINQGLADAKFNNFFIVNNDENICSIAIIGNMITSGDIDAMEVESFEPNKVYYYKTVRFVTMSVAAPENSVFEELENRVQTYTEEAQNWADEAERKVGEITNNFNTKDGFVRLDSNAKIPADLLPLEKTIEMIPIQNENELTYLSQANVGDIAFMSITTDEGKVLTKSWRLYGQYYIRNNWILQSNTFNTSSLYAEESGHSQDTTKVNGVLVRFGDIQKYTEDTKDGLYIITNYADEE